MRPCSVSALSFVASFLLVSGTLLSLGSGVAEARSGILGPTRIPASFRSWTLEDAAGNQTTLEQIHVPIMTSVHLGRNADLVLATAYGSSSLDPGEASDQGSSDLNGNSDVKAQVFFRTLGDRLLLQAGLSAPTGLHGLEPDELEILGAIGNPLLGFRMKHYGEGLNVTAGAAAAFPLGDRATFAVGGGFVQRGGYEFVKDQQDFTPGREISASVGLDVGGSTGLPLFRFDTSYRMFAEDELGETPIFQEGNQLELQASLHTRPSDFHFDLTGRAVLKEDNETLTEVGGTVEAVAADAGKALFARAEAGFDVTDPVYVALVADWTGFSGGDDALSKGTVFAVGPAVATRLGEAGSFRLAGQYLVGSTDDDTDGEGNRITGLDLSGFHIEASLTLHPDF